MGQEIPFDRPIGELKESDSTTSSSGSRSCRRIPDNDIAVNQGAFLGNGIGQVEVDLAFEETADAVIVSGSATKQTIEKFINEAKKCGIYAFLDLTNIDEPIPLLKSLKEIPEAIILHRAIDAEHEEKQKWKLIRSIKNRINKKMLVAVAGGIAPENVQETLTQGADIVVVGRYITQSKDVTHSTREFLRYMGSDIDLFRVHYATE